MKFYDFSFHKVCNKEIALFKTYIASVRYCVNDCLHKETSPVTIMILIVIIVKKRFRVIYVGNGHFSQVALI